MSIEQSHLCIEIYIIKTLILNKGFLHEEIDWIWQLFNKKQNKWTYKTTPENKHADTTYILCRVESSTQDCPLSESVRGVLDFIDGCVCWQHNRYITVGQAHHLEVKVHGALCYIRGILAEMQESQLPRNHSRNSKMDPKVGSHFSMISHFVSKKLIAFVSTCLFKDVCIKSFFFNLKIVVFPFRAKNRHTFCLVYNKNNNSHKG